MNSNKLRNNSGIGCLAGIVIGFVLSGLIIVSLYFFDGSVWTIISSLSLILLVGIILTLSQKPDWLSAGMFGLAVGIILAIVTIPILIAWAFHPFGD
jgi:tetrahydromethanopterin S-methyltransferase subunit F